MNSGIVPGLARSGRAEHVEVFNAKPLQVSFVLPQSADGFVAFHKTNIANRSLRFHDFRLTVVAGATFAGSVYLRGFSFPDFRRRTPGPPPFSSMNSTPVAPPQANGKLAEAGRWGEAAQPRYAGITQRVIALSSVR